MDSQAGLTAAILATPRPEAERAASILDLASVTGFDPEGLNLLNKGYREGGFQGLLEALHEIQVDAPAGDWLLSPLFKIWVDGHLGRMHEAIETLEEMYAERSPGMSYVNVGPFFDPIRSEPRFKEILAAMNFPDPPSGR